MIKPSKALNDCSSGVCHDGNLDSGRHVSGSMLKASSIAPRDIIDELPEALLRWIHEDLDGREASPLTSRWASPIDFESIVIDRLFPVRDTRPFIRRLREHSQATALAASMLAERNTVSAKIAWVCGWLHDMGIASCIRHADDVCWVQDDAALVELWPTILRSSAQHGIRLASRWRLPSAIRHAIREHESFVTLHTPSQIGSVMYVGEYVASLVGFEFHEQSIAVHVDRAMATLGVGEGDVMAIGTRTDQFMRRLRAKPRTAQVPDCT
jgi:hypothetical protein